MVGPVLKAVLHNMPSQVWVTEPKRHPKHGGKKTPRPQIAERRKFKTLIGSVPTTPDPNTSAKVLGYKWEPYRDAN